MSRDDPTPPAKLGLFPSSPEHFADSQNYDSQNYTGHSEWLRSVFERLQRPLLVYASKLLHGDWESAQDCVQEAFMRLCREPRERIESYVDAWLFKTCRHLAMDIHRMEARMKTQNEPAAIESLSLQDRDPGSIALLAEQQHEIEKRIADLPRLEQEVVLLRLGQGLSYKQIAEVMELSVSHVGVLLHQALTRLRAVIATEHQYHS
ncbi:MAG: sigma-70 family RNA polymerase sigma factor [Planctomycetes bacterium]|nr:sigma-70 family RNA polymerase sigma factor [Planctomycetota bacterium]